MADYLLDTNVIIDYLRGDARKTEKLLELVNRGDLLYSCEIIVAEIFSGMRDGEQTVTETFMNSLHYLPVEESTARKAGSYRRIYNAKGHHLTIADTLIAALAINKNLTLLTDNLKDFPMPELRKEKL